MPKRILAADDDKAMLRLYGRILSGPEYALSTAGTFAEAAALIRNGDYDLLVTDFMFPDGVGTELIKLFNEVRTGAKSLLVTGTPAALEKLSRERRGEYIEKPFKVEKFLEAVNEALR